MEMAMGSIVPMTTLHEHLEHLQSSIPLPSLFPALDHDYWLVLAPLQGTVKLFSSSNSPSKIKGQKMKYMEQIWY